MDLSWQHTLWGAAGGWQGGGALARSPPGGPSNAPTLSSFPPEPSGSEGEDAPPFHSLLHLVTSPTVPAWTRCTSDLNGDNEVSPGSDRAGGEWGGGAHWHPARCETCCGRGDGSLRKAKNAGRQRRQQFSALSVPAANPTRASVKESLCGICCPGAGEAAPVIMK